MAPSQAVQHTVDAETGVTFGVLDDIRRLSEEIRLCDRRRKELVLRRREIIDKSGFTGELEPVDFDNGKDYELDSSTSQLPADFHDNDHDGLG